MSESMWTVVSNAGVLGVFFWWATSKLIPQLQKERQEAIRSFHDEMEAERKLHREANDKLLELLEKVLDRMMVEKVVN